MKFKDFDISKESVLQSLLDAGLEFEEFDSGVGAVIEIDGNVMPIPQNFSLFETVTPIDEYISIVKYTTETSNQRFSNGSHTYSIKLDKPYLNASNGDCAVPPAA